MRYMVSRELAIPRREIGQLTTGIGRQDVLKNELGNKLKAE
jgi:hypothetical protein